MSDGLGRKRGPYKWTAERVAAVCRRHAEGAFLKHACALEGGSVEGLRAAMARDERVRLDVLCAHALGVQAILERMYAPGRPRGAWRREAWLLERFDPTTFAPPDSRWHQRRNAPHPSLQSTTVIV